MIDFMEYSPALDSIREEWVADLRSATDPERLKEVVGKWSVLWTTPFPGRQEPHGIGDYDAPEVMKCLAANRKSLCKHGKAGEQCVSMRLLIPEIFLHAQLLAERYKVPSNCALQRLVEAGKAPAAGGGERT